MLRVSSISNWVGGSLLRLAEKTIPGQPPVFLEVEFARQGRVLFLEQVCSTVAQPDSRLYNRLPLFGLYVSE